MSYIYLSHSIGAKRVSAHRWAVMEQNVVHGDISHGNIFILAEGVGKEKKKKRKEFMGKDRPIFVNEI